MDDSIANALSPLFESRIFSSSFSWRMSIWCCWRTNISFNCLLSRWWRSRSWRSSNSHNADLRERSNCLLLLQEMSFEKSNLLALAVAQSTQRVLVTLVQTFEERALSIGLFDFLLLPFGAETRKVLFLWSFGRRSDSCFKIFTSCFKPSRNSFNSLSYVQTINIQA